MPNAARGRHIPEHSFCLDNLGQEATSKIMAMSMRPIDGLVRLAFLIKIYGVRDAWRIVTEAPELADDLKRWITRENATHENVASHED
jgi:hypothetical protein